MTDGPEDAAVAEDDDGERDEEDEGEEQHRVRPDRRGEGHVVPGAGSHQAFWHVRTWGGDRVQLVLQNTHQDLEPSLTRSFSWFLDRFLVSQNIAVKETSSEQETFGLNQWKLYNLHQLLFFTWTFI